MAEEEVPPLTSGHRHCPYHHQVLLSIFLVLVFAVQSSTAIMCWECNSRYDRNCADPFRNETFEITDCNMRDLEHFPGQKASVCRKIIQKVRDDYRFVRGCGWLSSEKESTECFKRAGTFNVLVQYCSCDTDGCNSATTGAASFWLMSALLALSAMAAK